MLAPRPSGRFEVFSGASKLQRITPYTALVHADPNTPELGALIGEMSDRTDSGYLFGGLAASRTAALHIADGVWRGGLSGVAFGAGAPFVSRVTQGCQPVGVTRRVTRCHDNVVEALDEMPALDVLLQELAITDLDDHRLAVWRAATLAGLTDASGTALARPGIRHRDPGAQPDRPGPDRGAWRWPMSSSAA